MSTIRVPATAPLWLKDQNNRYWMEYLPDTRSLYVQINVMLDKDAETVAQFFERVRALYDSQSAERLIPDIRQNNGGNHLAFPLVYGIVCHPERRRRSRSSDVFLPCTPRMACVSARSAAP